MGKDAAVLWTDGRYYLQAGQQLSDAWTLQKTDEPIKVWLNETLTTLGIPVAPSASALQVGFDAFTVSPSELQRLVSAVNERVSFVSLQSLNVSTNLIDAAAEACDDGLGEDKVDWHQLMMVASGASHDDKLSRIGRRMQANGATLLLVSALDAVAWLFNLRHPAGGIPDTPLFYAYAIVSRDAVTGSMKASLYCAAGADDLPSDVSSALVGDNVTISPYDQFAYDVARLVQGDGSDACPKVWYDSAFVSSAVEQLVPDEVKFPGSFTLSKDLWPPIAYEKGIKNAVELDGFRACHVRDGSAVTTYLAWLDEVVGKGGHVDECTGAAKLEELRKYFGGSRWISPSFETISGSGANGAVIHYRAQPATCAKLKSGDVYLVDSGGQYSDGTTDITRTVLLPWGPSNGEGGNKEQLARIEWAKRCYTRVLQCHIDLATAVFPRGTTGLSLDTFSRGALWKDGLDFAHGTGHGVGFISCVHEGPHSISFRPRSNEVGFVPNMVVTIEPGYYQSHAFGIRIENIVACRGIYSAAGTSVCDRPQQARDGVQPGQQWPENCHASSDEFDAEAGFLAFEQLTFAPLDRHLIDKQLLSIEQTTWVDTYHASVMDTLRPVLEKATADGHDDAQRAISYLERMCAPL